MIEDVWHTITPYAAEKLIDWLKWQLKKNYEHKINYKAWKIKNKEIMNIVTKDTWQKLILTSKIKNKK